MKIPRAQLARVAALEARVASREDPAGLLRLMTDAELEELRAILVGVTPPCPTCGIDPRQEPRRYCHHDQVVVTWSRFKPDARERVLTIYRQAKDRAAASILEGASLHPSLPARRAP